MVARETNIVNAFETTLAAQLASGGTSMNLANDPGIDSPAYFVIDPDSDSNREVVLWTSGTNHAAATITRDIDSKHGTDPTHASGTKVRLAVVKQHIDEAHDAIQQGFVLEDGDGTEVTINPAVSSGAYTAREVKFVEGGGIDIDWTDTDNGTDGDPYDLTFTVNVDTAEIAADAITGAKIADDAVDSEHLVDGSIDTAHIGNLQVTTGKLAADAVDGTKIADDAINSEHYTDGSIDTAHYAAGSVDTTALGADAVTEAKIADDAVESEHLNDNVISGQTDLASGLALTDELLISDGGTLKKGDVSLIADAIDGAGIDASAGTLVNAAIGKQSIWVPAAAMTPTQTNGAAAIAGVDTGSNTGPDMYALNFDASTEEHAQFSIAMPSYWDESVALTFQAYWSSATTDNDGVSWGLSAVALANDDSLNTAFGTEVVVDDLNIGTAYELHITAESGAVTVDGSPAAGELVFFNVARVVGDSNDTASEDASLLGIKIFYTTDDVHEA
tara:strand:+ start:502 stop:2010 length:1509 start_codon:yes stop_codon:yes gene_type:complete